MMAAESSSAHTSTSPNPTDSPFPEIPAPWTAQGEVFLCVAKLPKTPAYPALPGAYDPLEASSPNFSSPSVSGEFKGGLGTIMVVRYTSGSGGPYDELMVIPGYFEVPSSVDLPGVSKQGTTKKLRITRIYVSTLVSVYNGRKNWNIPKHLARFNFQRIDAATTIVSVYHPGEGDLTQEKPFFKSEFKKIPYHPTIPLSTTLMPSFLIDLTSYNPPNPQSGDWRQDGCIGTTKWQTCFPSFKGQVTGCWTTGLLGQSDEERGQQQQGEEGQGLTGAKKEVQEERWGDGVGFPDIKLQRYAIWWRDVEFYFPPSLEPIGQEGKKDK